VIGQVWGIRVDDTCPILTSAGARGFATDQVTFETQATGKRPQVWEQTSDGGNFPRSCELAESPVTAVPLYHDDDDDMMMMIMMMMMMI